MKSWKDSFNKREIKEYQEPLFKAIGDDWMLLTAGNIEKFNTMTASWGTFGVFWHKPVATCFIRPTRHTYTIAEKSDHYSLCFFDEKYKEILQYCGSHSGRDSDKIKETGLIPIQLESGAIGFEQARLIVECQKILHTDIDPKLFPVGIDEKFYPKKDYHRVYYGEILAIYHAI